MKLSPIFSFFAAAALLATLPGCAAMPHGKTAAEASRTATAATPAPPSPPVLQPYFDTLALMAPGDPARQRGELEACRC